MPKKAKKPLMKNVSPRMKSQTELATEIALLTVDNAKLKSVIKTESTWRISYQEENGKLHRELLEKRIGSLIIGVWLGLLLAALIVYLY
jgi:hypothetical protein